MTTTIRAMPLASRLGAIGSHITPNVRRIAALALSRNPRSARPVDDLSDWILADIGLQRERRMSPEARRARDRLNSNALW